MEDYFSKKKKKRRGLAGLPLVTSKANSNGDKATLSATHTGAALLGLGLGAALGKVAPVAGIATMVTGVVTGETHLIAAGGGMMGGIAMTVYKNDGGANGMDGFDFKQEFDNGIQRMKDLVMIGGKKAVFADYWLPGKTEEAVQVTEGTNGLNEMPDFYLPVYDDQQASSSYQAAQAQEESPVLIRL